MLSSSSEFTICILYFVREYQNTRYTYVNLFNKKLSQYCVQKYEIARCTIGEGIMQQRFYDDLRVNAAKNSVCY